ncbi:hypothetical protein NH287_03770 [Microbacterium sp. CnD16-F]|uniref:hypothetical protein n=1 Tax=Microbacterium sp. CnD16-F TaxID=2954493 RepID=UPI0020977B97|nr:hypothetical protein [Microbacterium sp. CnD16-F]MCO7202628.1 hypothetical protein [Microbacterium sp. CnD16-F]
MGIRPRQLVAWIVGAGVVALALFLALVGATVTATILVDQVPGADAGIASSPALDSAYATMAWTLPAFVAVVLIGVMVPLIAHRRRSRMR